MKDKFNLIVKQTRVFTSPLTNKKEMTQNCTVASAPGKVLLTGGYLVLEQAYTGLVIGTSARFYTIIKPESAGTPGTLTVHSPQFDQATWQYKAIADDDKLNFASMYGSLCLSLSHEFIAIALLTFYINTALPRVATSLSRHASSSHCKSSSREPEQTN